jgi:hypothetical protein
MLTLVVACCVGAAAPPKLSVCTGSVCTKHGSALMLEAAQGLSLSTESVNVVGTSCMSACKGRSLEGVAAFVSSTKSRAILERCDEPGAALVQARTALVRDLGAAPPELLDAALESKLAGDRAAADADFAAAVTAYTAALAALPRDTFEPLAADAAAAAAAARPPPK